ncbi:MAG: HAMP domain-containing protein [Thermoanaerobacteraceae bacterium]|nr:HAMP domain-containing protein [Thermoanaerobacteraceae bacterium]
MHRLARRLTVRVAALALGYSFLAFLIIRYSLWYQWMEGMSILPPGAAPYTLKLLESGFFKLALGGLILLTCGTYLVARSLLGPLGDMLPATRRIASGDLEQRLEVLTNDELGLLARHLNEMVDRLRSNIREISNERNKVRAILASLTDAVVAVDQVGRVMLCNPAAEALLKKKEHEMQQKYLLEIIRNHELDRLAKEILDKGKPAEAEVRLFPTSAGLFRVHGAPILGERGRIVGAVLSLRDITEIRRLEQMRSEFVANVSHELRTPLTSIRGFVETLLEGALADEKTSRRFLGIINSEAQRLQRLIEDLLTLSRVEHRRPEPVGMGASLPQAVARVMEVVRPLAEERGVSLKTDLPPDLPLLRLPEHFLDQILLNLLDNAIKYTPEGGSVTVTASREGSRARVQVRDTGIGIPAESLPRIFERFYRVDKARSRAMGGTGLGLAIVKHMVEAYGGTVGVESQVGKGSTFHFVVPLMRRMEGG